MPLTIFKPTRRLCKPQIAKETERFSGFMDTAFRQLNSVDFRNDRRIRSSILTTRFLTVYASHPQVAQRHDNTRDRPTRYGFDRVGWPCTNWISSKGFTAPSIAPPSPRFSQRDQLVLLGG